MPLLAAINGALAAGSLPSEVTIGEKLFAETRFAQFFAARCGSNVNAPLSAGDPVVQAFGAGPAMSCLACHRDAGLPRGQGAAAALLGSAAAPPRNPVPARDDGRATTVRNSPPLADALEVPGVLLHFDGEFATPEDLVKETFAGRNFGWLPAERAEARRHLARVVREDGGASADGSPRLSYATLLRGADASIPGELRLPEVFRMDVARASDDEIVDGCARLVGAFLRSLRFSRDAGGLHDGSPYDTFLALNRLARAPVPDQTPHEYARRLGEAVAALRAPRFVDDAARRLRSPDQAFRFGEAELRGLRIFFKAAIGAGQTGGAGNCAECHVPPHFTDFAFHNTGVAQDEFDALHGVGAFAKLTVPGLPTRAIDHDRWLQPTPLHPRAAGKFLAPAMAGSPDRTDLGLWNVYGNPDLPGPQRAIESLLNPGGRLAPDDVLANAVARFKTPGLRNLGQSAPYLHTGNARTIEETLDFYRRASELAHLGKLRNAPPEFFAVRLEAADIEPLAAFLRALNEN